MTRRTSPARAERAALADLFEEVGPAAPTLCAGWTTRDLAAHLVLRERRPDAAGGIMFGPLAGHTQRVQDGYTAREWAELVDRVRQGPPAWSFYALGPVDRAANTIEFFVHHEDVRRAQRRWAPRPPTEMPAGFEDLLWRLLTARARLLYRRARVGVRLRRDTGALTVARDGGPGVVVSGPSSELVLHAYGRTAHALVTVEGEPDAVRAFAETPLGV